MKRITIILLAASAVIATALSCDKTPDTAIVASRFELILGTHFDESGENVTKKWENTDEVALLRINDGEAGKTSAFPLMEGRSEGLFMFYMEGYGEGCEIIAFCPADAPVAYEDGELKITAPTVQDGNFRTLFIGRGISNGSSYLNKSIDMESYWHTFFVTVKKGHVVSKAELRSQTHNVTVDFDTDLDCSRIAKTFFIIMPPTSLEDGYDIILHTADEKTLTYTAEETAILDKGGKTTIYISE